MILRVPLATSRLSLLKVHTCRQQLEYRSHLHTAPVSSKFGFSHLDRSLVLLALNFP